MEDCWNRIGTWGQESPQCQRLEDLTHCRYCDIYVQASKVIAERETGKENLQTWGDRLANIPLATSRRSNTCVVFRFNDRGWAVPTMQVESVLDSPVIHPVPHCPDPIWLGVAYVDGEILACVSPAHVLRTTRDYDETPVRRLLVLNSGAFRFAVPVHEIVSLIHCDVDFDNCMPMTRTFETEGQIVTMLNLVRLTEKLVSLHSTA